MFEKLSRAAERAALELSRRQFLGHLGHGSLIAAVGLGALLASPGEALAGPCRKGYRRVRCTNLRTQRRCCPDGWGCQCEATWSGVECYCVSP